MRPPKFQLHLTTCLILMFVAGGLLWANMRPTQTYPLVDPHTGERFFGLEWGWPLIYCVEPSDLDLIGEAFSEMTGPDPMPDSPHHSSPSSSPSDTKFPKASLHPTFLKPSQWVINIATALAILTAAAVLSEWLIRRRRKSAEHPTP